MRRQAKLERMQTPRHAARKCAGRLRAAIALGLLASMSGCAGGRASSCDPYDLYFEDERRLNEFVELIRIGHSPETRAWIKGADEVLEANNDD